MKAVTAIGWILGGLLWVAPVCQAQYAVIDAAAIARLAQQLQTMEQQLRTARNQLNEAQRTFESMQGTRGMERLLSGTVRNYLPESWDVLESAITQAAAQYRQLSSEFQALVNSNAILSPQILASLSTQDRLELEAARRAVALSQVTSRQALQQASQRFTSLQQLIDAIPRATDQKGILDLQARIAVEQGMLMNEQTKLQMLTQALEAEEKARYLRLEEEAMRSFGSFRELPPLGL